MWYVIVLGGGSGSRMGLGYNKVLAPLAGMPVIRRSVDAFAGLAQGAVAVCPAQERPRFERALAGAALPVTFANGGENRQASVWNGLQALPPSCTHVLIHDGARCLVDADVIRRAMDGAAKTGAAVAAVAVTDTVKQCDAAGLVTATPPREQLRAVQTPQAFSLPLILEAHRKAAADGFCGTDDASLVERLGHPVLLTEGSRTNLKLTQPEDLTMAEQLLSLPPFRVGTGYDVHRLVPGRMLVLCGVPIAHEKGLDGHSDADVAVHALMDAMLGAAALGDIGQHFPDTDPRYSGISSMKLLAQVCALLAEHGLRVGNADLTIVAQAPKLAPHIPVMRQNLAQALDLPPDRVSVKATTTERLGFEGRQEGISAQAVVLLCAKSAAV